VRARILDFVQALRARGVDVSVAEALDGVRASAPPASSATSSARRSRRRS
jgi:hypothetical protein